MQQWTTQKPNATGIYLYREFNTAFGKHDYVSVYVYRDTTTWLVDPIPPHWNGLVRPFWTLEELQGEWFKLETGSLPHLS